MPAWLYVAERSGLQKMWTCCTQKHDAVPTLYDDSKDLLQWGHSWAADQMNVFLVGEAGSVFWLGVSERDNSDQCRAEIKVDWFGQQQLTILKIGECAWMLHAGTHTQTHIDDMWYLFWKRKDVKGCFRCCFLEPIEVWCLESPATEVWHQLRLLGIWSGSAFQQLEGSRSYVLHFFTRRNISWFPSRILCLKGCGLRRSEDVLELSL